MNFDFLRISRDKRFKNFFYFHDSLDTRGLRNKNDNFSFPYTNVSPIFLHTF